MTGAVLDVAAIGELSNTELKRAWEQVHGVPSPAVVPSLLARDLAHRTQLAAVGGALDRRLARRLRDLIAADAGAVRSAASSTSSTCLAAGSQLLREWGGVTHRVIVEPGGRYLYDGRHWRSLSAIARAVTGTRWSGPRFFGIGSSGS
jgi:hypothetical protein